MPFDMQKLEEAVRIAAASDVDDDGESFYAAIKPLIAPIVEEAAAGFLFDTPEAAAAFRASFASNLLEKLRLRAWTDQLETEIGKRPSLFTKP